MPSFKIAHLREIDSTGHPVDLIIIPLEPSFGAKTEHEQNAAIAEFQLRAENADLLGRVCPVWEDSATRRMRFIAPPNWHPYFQSLNLPIVMASLNKTLYW
jgi:hypothetical protein